MDEQTRMARFESMRKTPGRGRFSKNKKLFLKHKELEKICANEIRRHEFDTKVATIDIKREQLLVEKKQQRLKLELNKCELSREKTQLFLNDQEKKHQSQQRVGQSKIQQVHMEDIEKAVQDLHMPSYMRQRLLQYV